MLISDFNLLPAQPRLRHLHRTTIEVELKTLKTTIQEFFWPAISGVLLTLAFPKAGFAVLSWVALVPLLFSVRNDQEKQSFQKGFVSGFIHYITLLYWLVPTLTVYGYIPSYVSLFLVVLLASYLALYMGIFTLLLIKLRPPSILLVCCIPVIFVTLEYIRSYFLSGFPWGVLGYSQYQNLLLVQIADITGVLGVSFLIAMGNAVILMLLLFVLKSKWQNEAMQPSIVTFSGVVYLFLAGLTVIYGVNRIRFIENLADIAPKTTIAAVQGNVDQSVKWNNAFQYSSTLKHLKLSQKTMKSDPDLIVWPETAAPFYFNHDMGLTKIVLRRVKTIGTSFLIGCPSFIKISNNYNYLNSATLISPEGNIIDQYNKVHLVPFGEYVPFKSWLPDLGTLVAQAGDFVPGEKGRTLPWNSHVIGPQICFEIIFPELSRTMSQNGAEIIINITNDAWFGTSGGPYQHFAMTIFRAIENRRSLVRAANTGISGFISPTGKVISQTPLCQETTLTAQAPFITYKSVYTRYGDRFAIICLAMVAGLVLLLVQHTNLSTTKDRRS